MLIPTASLSLSVPTALPEFSNFFFWRYSYVSPDNSARIFQFFSGDIALSVPTALGSTPSRLRVLALYGLRSPLRGQRLLRVVRSIVKIVGVSTFGQIEAALLHGDILVFALHARALGSAHIQHLSPLCAAGTARRHIAGR